MAIELGRRGSLNSEKEIPRGPALRTPVWAGAIGFLLLLCFGFLRVAGDRLYDYPTNPDLKSLPKDSAIICLAGGKHRIEAAYSLYAEDVGDRLLIVGAGPRSTIMTLARAHAPSAAMKIPSARWDNVAVETESRNTIENAFVVKRYIERNPQIKNLILVTSAYHMRRAQYMIARQIPDDITIIPYSPPIEAIERGSWWRSWLGVQVTAEEYLKFLLATLLIPRLGYF